MGALPTWTPTFAASIPPPPRHPPPFPPGCSYDEAAEDCRRAISLDPANAKAYVRGAKAELALGNLEEAQALAQQGERRRRCQRNAGGCATITVSPRLTPPTRPLPSGVPSPAGLLRDPRDESARGERQAALLANTRLTKAQAALASREFDRSLSLFNTLLDTSPASYVFKLLRIESMVRGLPAPGAHAHRRVHTPSRAFSHAAKQPAPLRRSRAGVAPSGAPVPPPVTTRRTCNITRLCRRIGDYR